MYVYLKGKTFANISAIKNDEKSKQIYQINGYIPATSWFISRYFDSYRNLSQCSQFES
jgi:hypothetical protein